MNKILKIKEELGNIGYSIRSIIRYPDGYITIVVNPIKCHTIGDEMSYIKYKLLGYGCYVNIIMTYLSISFFTIYH